MPCKDICVNFKTVKIVTGSHYLEGEKCWGVGGLLHFHRVGGNTLSLLQESFESAVEAKQVGAMRL